jgi:hypothetical protein
VKDMEKEQMHKKIVQAKISGRIKKFKMPG